MVGCIKIKSYDKAVFFKFLDYDALHPGGHDGFRDFFLYAAMMKVGAERRHPISGIFYTFTRQADNTMDNKKEVERAELHRTIWAIADANHTSLGCSFTDTSVRTSPPALWS